MADGSQSNVYRTNPGSGQLFEGVDQDRGDGTARVLQAIFSPCVAGAVVVDNPKGTAGAPVGVTTSATNVADANDKRIRVHIRNEGAAKVRISASGTATADSYPLYPGEEYTDDRTTKAWSAKADSGTCNVFVMEISLP